MVHNDNYNNNSSNNNDSNKIIFSHIVRETESNMVPFMQRRGLETWEEKAREVQKLASSPYLVSKHHDAVVCFSSDGSANTLRDQRSKWKISVPK